MGILQADAYAGYNQLYDPKRHPPRVTSALCWSHARRKFYELAQSGPAPIATEAPARIATLYQVEGEIRGCPAEERRAARQARYSMAIGATILSSACQAISGRTSMCLARCP